MTDLPGHYFRLRERNATVYRVSTRATDQRIEMEPIAVVNLVKGEVRPQGERALTDDDRAAIDAWLARRREIMARRETDDIHRTIEHMNHLAHWLQARATDAQVGEIADDLLLAMHDLRSVLVRRKAEMISRRRRGAQT